MILAVSANRSSFHKVMFDRGFNVVLANRTKDSTRKDSANGLGKSTLIEIIRFCLGSNAPAKWKPVLSGWEFSTTFDVAGRVVTATRAVDKPTAIDLTWESAGPPIGLGLTASIPTWRGFLAAEWFGIGPDVPKTFAPSFGSLIGYFIRPNRDAFSNPFDHSRHQAEWDRQVNNLFLLGLEWQDAREWQLIKNKRKALQDLRKAAQANAEEQAGSRGELDALRVRLVAEVAAEAASLSAFRVHERYRELEAEANELTVELQSLRADDFADNQLLSMYTRALATEAAPPPRDLNNLYEEAGVSLPGVALRRIAAVEEFHGTVIQNRREFLAIEIQRLQASIAQRSAAIADASNGRADILSVLSSSGALDEFRRLQDLHTQHIVELRAIEERIAAMRELEEQEASLKLEEQRLQIRARQNLDARRAQLELAIRLFNENSQALYKVPGSLIVDITATGFKFGVDIPKAGSEGIDKMKIFCYDLTRAEIWATLEKSPRLLVHDSTMFDAVDRRQVAAAVELVASKSRERGFQYICLLNSDTLPSADFSPDFDLSRFVKLELTDMHEGGTLLGMRF